MPILLFCSELILHNQQACDDNTNKNCDQQFLSFY